MPNNTVIDGPPISELIRADMLDACRRSDRLVVVSPELVGHPRENNLVKVTGSSYSISRGSPLGWDDYLWNYDCVFQVVKPENNTELSTETLCHEAVAEIIMAVMSDPQRSGYAIDTQHTGGTIEPDADRPGGYVSFTVHFRTLEGKPRQQS